MNKDEVRENLTNTQNWLRVLFMIFFAVVAWLLTIILPVIVVVQVLFSLISGRDNDNLRQLGGNLSVYFFQILHYLTYNTEERPFPFADFPTISEVERQASARDAEDKQDSAQGADDDVFDDISFAGSSRKAGDDDDVATEGEADESSRHAKKPDGDA